MHFVDLADMLFELLYSCRNGSLLIGEAPGKSLNRLALLHHHLSDIYIFISARVLESSEVVEFRIVASDEQVQNVLHIIGIAIDNGIFVQQSAFLHAVSNCGIFGEIGIKEILQSISQSHSPAAVEYEVLRVTTPHLLHKADYAR